MEKEIFERLLTEFNENNKRATKLREFILDEKSKKIDNLNRDLLIAQLKAMEAYLSILSIRIGLNAPKDVKESKERMNKKVIYTDNSNELLNRYLRDISKYKLLDSSELAILVKQAQDGDLVARDKVVRANLRFVVTVAKQFQNRGIPLLDLISSGNEGLIRAVELYDPNRGVTFLSYAVWWIKQKIYNSIYWQGREIRLPMSQQLLVINILDTTSKFVQEHHRNPSSEELSNLTSIPIEQIDYLAQFSNKVMSIDSYIGGDEDNNQLGDIIPDGNPLLDEVVNKKFVTKELESILSNLTVREHDLLCMLYGIGMDQINPKVVSAMFGVGSERIRQMKEGALAKLRRRFSNQLKKFNIMTADNYPMGASNDPNAPYNDSIPKEGSLKFELKVKGEFYPSYYLNEELDEKTTNFRKKLEDLIDKFDFGTDDYVVDNIFAEVW